MDRNFFFPGERQDEQRGIGQINYRRNYGSDGLCVVSYCSDSFMGLNMSKCIKFTLIKTHNEIQLHPCHNRLSYQYRLTTNHWQGFGTIRILIHFYHGTVTYEVKYVYVIQCSSSTPTIFIQEELEQMSCSYVFVAV